MPVTLLFHTNADSFMLLTIPPNPEWFWTSLGHLSWSVSVCVSLALRRREDYTQMNYLPFLSSISLYFYQHDGLNPVPFPDRRILRMLPTAHCLMSLESGLLFKPYYIYYIVIYNIYYVELYYTNVEIRFSSFFEMI